LAAPTARLALFAVTVSRAFATVRVTAEVVAEVNPLLLVYAAETVCMPALSPVRVAVATPLTTVALIVELSTVKTTVPAGVIDGPETVALAVTVCPYTGDAGEKAPSTTVAVGAEAGAVSTSCTDDGVDKAALTKLPLKVAVSVVVRNVVGL
jgi:hypothetical protein